MYRTAADRLTFRYRELAPGAAGVGLVHAVNEAGRAVCGYQGPLHPVGAAPWPGTVAGERCDRCWRVVAS